MGNHMNRKPIHFMITGLILLFVFVSKRTSATGIGIQGLGGDISPSPLVSLPLLGAMAVTFCIIIILIFVIAIALAIWNYMDAKRRGKSGILWLVLNLILPFIAAIIWLVIRPRSGGGGGGSGSGGSGGNVDKEILYVIRAMTVLLGAGVGLESTMEHVANSSYGVISVMFQKILDESKRGEYIEDSLQREANLTRSSAMRKVLNTMVLGSKGEVDLVAALGKIAEREMKDREQQIDKFIETLGNRSEVYMTMGILVPIIIVVVIFVAQLIDQTGLAAGGSMKVMTEPAVIAGLLFGDLGILGFIAIKTKLDEPKI